MISKRVDAAYTSGRRDDWVKSKCSKRQEFVVGGYTTRRQPHGLRRAVARRVRKRPAPSRRRVGTGFNQKSLTDIKKKLRALEIGRDAVRLASPRGRGLHWVKPKLVCEVSFAEWTSDGSLRHASFHGLRADKDRGRSSPRRRPRSSAITWSRRRRVRNLR